MSDLKPESRDAPGSPLLTLVWSDPYSSATGHLVVDSVVRGIASGGLRMRAGCTAGEVADLARAMTVKEALLPEDGQRYRSLGGAKGGIDFDPDHPGAPEVLRRFLRAVRPLVAEVWAVGEDLGTTQEAIDDAVSAAGLTSCVQAALPYVSDGAAAGLARVRAASRVTLDGLRLGDVVGGYGAARAAVAALVAHGEDPAGRTAVVQGFGSMGGAAARYLVAAGLRVVAVADRDGLAVHDAGLDVEHLLRTRTPDGRMQRTPAYDWTDRRDDWADVPADVVVTAATSYAVDHTVAAGLRCRYLVEAANVSLAAGVPARLHERGILVVPDVIANAAANAWWWWTLFGDVGPDAPAALGMIDRRIRTLVATLVDEVRACGDDPHTVVARMARARIPADPAPGVDRGRDASGAVAQAGA